MRASGQRLASKIRQQSIETREGKEQTAILYRLNKDLAAFDSLGTCYFFKHLNGYKNI